VKTKALKRTGRIQATGFSLGRIDTLAGKEYTCLKTENTREEPNFAQSTIRQAAFFFNPGG
jgi:hypothetical protein